MKQASIQYFFLKKSHYIVQKECIKTANYLSRADACRLDEMMSASTVIKNELYAKAWNFSNTTTKKAEAN